LKDKIEPDKETWYIKDILNPVGGNKIFLKTHRFKDNFFGPEAQANFQVLQSWANEGDDGKSVFVTHVNVQEMEKEAVYAFVVDKIHERIIIAFRGTDPNIFAGTGFMDNIRTDTKFIKVGEELPESLKGKVNNVGDDKIWLHRGFYDYLNNETKDKTDTKGTKLRDQIMTYLKEDIKEHPGFTVCTTGHSLGAALSTLEAYYLAIDDEIPSPVVNVNFESPRVGNSDFLNTCRYLEGHNKLQICRYVNDNDLITTVPWLGYDHVGFEVRMPKKDKIEVMYPRTNLSFFERMRLGWRNSIVANIDLSYDHSDYFERMKTHEKALTELGTLTDMYKNKELTGPL